MQSQSECRTAPDDNSDGYEIDIQLDDAFSSQVAQADLRSIIARTLQQEAVAEASLTLVITDDATQRELNLTYRAIDAPTDVLSFAARDAAEASPHGALPPELAAELNRYLGDIIIALPYATRQAKRYGNSLAAELRLLTVHGVLHLLGYDHATQDEEAVMWQAQNRVLADYGDPDSSQRIYPD